MKYIRFLHIPKTAGTTFGSILAHKYSRKRTFEFTGNLSLDIDRFKSLSEIDRKRTVLFIGHSPIVTGIEEVDNARTIVFLRDPIERVKSFCRHVASGGSPYLREAFPPESFNLDSFLESKNIELSNLQTRMLINRRSYEDLSFFESMTVKEGRNKALDNLCDKISCFGIQEYFDESLIIFWSFLKLGRIPFYTSIRKSSRLIEFRQHHIDKIANLNAIDIALYKAAKEKFLDIIKSAAFDKVKLKRFQYMNAIMSPTLKIWRRFRM